MIPLAILVVSLAVLVGCELNDRKNAQAAAARQREAEESRKIYQRVLAGVIRSRANLEKWG